MQIVRHEKRHIYKWRAKYGGMDTLMITRLKELEAENSRLKRIYADECLKAMIVQEALTKKFYGHLYTR
jgi:putative transposase